MAPSSPGMKACGWGERPYSRANRLDIVAIGIDQKRRVVSRAVILARAGAAIVATAALQALAMECLDRIMIPSAKRDMRAIGLPPLVQVQPQRRRALRSEAGIT